MNKDEILDDSIFEEINDDIQSDELALLDELDLDMDMDILEEESIIADEPLLENIDEIGEIDLPSTEEIEDTLAENITVVSDEDDFDVIAEDDIAPLDDELETLETFAEDETSDIVSEDESIVEDVSEVSENIIEPEQCIEECSDINLISNDLNNIQIEFGIEAKGFILSVKMMEAMIEKGYIFKDILNDKVFDAVMIFNGNLDNTVMTKDIKIKIDDGNIQLIKG
jgi:hypothetical protein